MYSLLEQHNDGSWWYHPGDTFDTEAEVEECFRETFGHFDPDRPHMAFNHQEPMFQEHATCTTDFNTFEFFGVIFWPESLKGTTCKKKQQEDMPMTDEQLKAMPKDDANKLLCMEDQRRWVQLHNATANLYFINDGKIADVDPSGWWY